MQDQIPNKLYFTIGEVSKLCSLEPHVLRYWEQEFSQLKPNKRCGNRRYYTRDEILLIRRIKNLLYEQGFTIEGARLKLSATAVDDKCAHSNNEFVGSVMQQLKGVLKILDGA